MAPFINSAGLCVGGKLKTVNKPPNSKYQILIWNTNFHWHLFKLRPLWKRIYPLYPLAKLLDPIKQRYKLEKYDRRQNAKTVKPHMANLPNICLQSHVKPFSNTDVDYFRPIQVKTSHKTRRSQGTLKTYGVIFTWINTRAIHIKLFSDQLTDSFILSLHRFLAQRGHVNIMQPDNGTNFIGAVKEINDGIKNLKNDKITTYLDQHQIKWQFNRPLIPWMGGAAGKVYLKQ